MAASGKPIVELSSVNRTTKELCVVVLLVGIGAGARVLLRDVPNFAPVAGIALFAGYFFQHPSPGAVGASADHAAQ